MRKVLWLTALLLIGALVLSACAAPAAAPAAPAAEAPATEAAAEAPAADAAAPAGACAPAADGAYAGVDPSGQAVVWWHNHAGSRGEKLLPLIAQFNESNECGINVEAQFQGNYDDIRDKMNSSIAAGEIPAALIVGYQNDQKMYQVNDSLVDLNTLMTDATWGMTEEEISDFYPTFLEQSVATMFDNQRLGFPPNRSMEVLYYNQTWLEELGFSGPPTNPDEFKEMACAAAAANGDGTGGFILSDDASAVASWVFAFGGNILTDDGANYVYNSQEAVEALTFLKDLYDSGCAYFFTEGFPNPQFAIRKAIFTQGSTSGAPFYAIDVNTVAQEQSKEPDIWGVTAIPHTTAEPVQNLYGGDVMITKTTPEQELAAWLFVKWFTSPEFQAQWDEISGYFPTRKSTNDFFSDALTGNTVYNQGLQLLPYASYEPQLLSYTNARDEIQKAFNEIMQGADVQSTLDSVTEKVREAEQTAMEEVQ